jgi:KDO2-lipid IV(A) lauroyltransferase
MGKQGLTGRFARWRDAMEYVALRLLDAVTKILPMEGASDFAGWSWRHIAPRLRRHHRALDNLTLAYPELSPEARQRIAVEMWENLGRTFAEFFYISRIIAEERVALDPAAGFKAMADSGHFVICGLHMGNWEIMAQVGARRGLPLTGVYQALSNPLVDRWIRSKREPMYPGGLFEKSPTTPRVLMRVVKNGASPAFLADLREGRGIPAPFFGHSAMSNHFPATIARSLGLPLFAVRVLRKPGIRFSMRVEPVDVPRTADRDADIRHATENLQVIFEEFVREAPGQWMWAHRRWD